MKQPARHVEAEIWHTAASAARYLGVARTTFYAMITNGRIVPHMSRTAAGAPKYVYAQSDLDKLSPKAMSRSESVVFEATQRQRRLSTFWR